MTVRPRCGGEVVCGPVRLFAAADTSEPASQIRCEGRFSGADSGGQVRQGEGSAPAPCRSGRLTVLVVAVEDAGDLRADRS